MAKKQNKNKGGAKPKKGEVKPKADAKEKEIVEETSEEEVEEVTEAEEVEETPEEEVEEEAEEETPEEEVEEETEDETSEEEVEAEVETEDASGEVTKFAVYKGAVVVRVFNNVTHGKDFKKIAKAHAERIGGEAKAFVDKSDDEKETTIVDIVNKNGSLVRRFALSTHGKDYRKIAEAFVEKHGAKKGLVIKS